MIVPQGYHYYIDNFNMYHFQAIIPYTTYNYRVDVLFPVSHIVEQKKEPPKVEVSDIRSWLLSIADELEDENGILYQLTRMLIEVARNTIDYDWCGSDASYIQILSYYVGHYLTLHLKDIKDEQQRMSLSPQLKDEVETVEEKKITMTDSEFGDFRATLFGKLFWSRYGVVAGWVAGGYGIL